MIDFIECFYAGRRATPRQRDVYAELAALPPDALVSEEALCRIFERGHLTIKRQIERGELPAPAWMRGENVWLAGRLNAHFRKLAEDAEREHERKHAEIKRRSA